MSKVDELYVGLMSGTSMDGVDAVLACFTGNARPVVLASASLPMPATLRAEFLALNDPGPNELERAAKAGNRLAELYAKAVCQLLVETRLKPCDIQAVGAHGQTVRHDPDSGYTIQINAPARLVELTGISVVADFRSRDIAAGGQGAPLVPAFHHALFASSTPRVVLNLGGIANVTVLHPNRPIKGFDTGPANVLLDAWIHEKDGKNYDHDGQWAATGTVNQALLDVLFANEPWLSLPPPKSTGRHLFNPDWLRERLNTHTHLAGAIRDADVQATLQAFTAKTVAHAIKHYAPDSTELLVCGGGALNSGLMTAIAGAVPNGCRVTTTAQYGVPVQLVEALAFAWLARAWDHQHPGSLPEVTGAKAPHVLGCKYPA